MKNKNGNRSDDIKKVLIGKYLWCIHCQRIYKKGEHRVIGNLKMCPYQGCNGDAVLDGLEWETIREHNPEYPEVPEKGVAYSQ